MSMHIILYVCMWYLIAVCMSTLNLINWQDRQGKMNTYQLLKTACGRWTKFGMLLGLPGNQLDVLSRVHTGDTVTSLTRIMQYWLDGLGGLDYPVTWEGLYCLLGDVGYDDVAHELREAVMGIPPSK